MWLSPCNAASCVAVAWMFGASAARAGGLTFDQAQRLALAGAPALVAAVARSEANPEELRPAGEQPDLQLALDVDNLPIEGQGRSGFSDQPLAMRRIAVPMVGGMLTAPLLSLRVIPAAYRLLRRREGRSALST